MIPLIPPAIILMMKFSSQIPFGIIKRIFGMRNSSLFALSLFKKNRENVEAEKKAKILSERSNVAGCFVPGDPMNVWYVDFVYIKTWNRVAG